MAPLRSRNRASHNLNLLRRGTSYRATTSSGDVVGEYLGMEIPYGDPAILLRNGVATASIAIRHLTAIKPIAA